MPPIAAQLAVVELLPSFLAQHPTIRLVVVDSVTFHFRQVRRGGRVWHLLRAETACGGAAAPHSAMRSSIWLGLASRFTRVAGMAHAAPAVAAAGLAGHALLPSPCFRPTLPSIGSTSKQEYGDMAARTRQLAQMAQQLMQLAGERDVAVGAGRVVGEWADGW